MTWNIFYWASNSAYILRDVRVDEGQNKGGGVVKLRKATTGELLNTIIHYHFGQTLNGKSFKEIGRPPSFTSAWFSLTMTLKFYGLFCVIKLQFCGCAQKRFGICRYHTGIFTELCKVGHEKKWAGKWDCYPSQKLSSFHSRKNCECFYCTPITIPTMYSNYCRQYLLHVGLFWFHLSLYKSFLLFYSSLL